MRRNDRGYSLVEILFVVALIGILVRFTTPPIFQLGRRFAARAIAGRVRMVLEAVRGEAETCDRGRAVKFSATANGWRYSVYEDGDGDGVRNDDIAKGLDPLVRGPLMLLDDAAGFRVGLPQSGVPHPDTDVWMSLLASPVNFNSSTLCSFSPNGDGTPGTVYLTDGRQTSAVRCAGNGGRISVLLYDLDEKKWLR